MVNYVKGAFIFSGTLNKKDSVSNILFIGTHIIFSTLSDQVPRILEAFPGTFKYNADSSVEFNYYC